ncbi:uncharacterized protein MYCGRDRAFT_75046, partial [Zymoseptoria tritici IPO323]
MIKNHYSRQIEGGRSDLEDAANNANVRRERGEDLGPPPTPTPIVKRKYDNPQQASTPRAIAPQKDAMDMDEPMSLSQAPMPKHNSPPQFPPKPRYVSSAQGTPVPAPRAIPGPMPPASNPHSSGNATPMQQPPQPHKQDWQSRVLGGQGSQSSPPNAPLDRDGRAPYFPHHRSSMMSSMNSRGNPSPPPHAMGHSRTSSMNSQQPAGSRDQRGAMGGPPPSSHLHNNPYGASHQPPPFSQAPPAQNRAVHSHNSSITGDPNMMPRFPSGPANDHSREEAIRR